MSSDTPALLVGSIAPDLAVRALGDLTEGALDYQPMEGSTAVPVSHVPLQDRAVLRGLQMHGYRQLALMTTTLDNLRTWIAVHFTATDLVAIPAGNAADFSLGSVKPA